MKLSIISDPLHRVAAPLLSAAAFVALGFASCTDAISNLAIPFQSEDDGMWGFVRADGTVLYEDEFQSDQCPTVAVADRFYAQTKSGNWQLYSTEKIPAPVGNEVYASVSPFSKDVAVVTPEGGKISIINREGEVVKKFDKVGSKEVTGCQGFDSEGYAIFAVTDKEKELYGLLNHKGDVVIEPRYCMLNGQRGQYFAIDKREREELEDSGIEKVTVLVLDAKGEELYSFKGNKYASAHFAGDGYLSFVKEDLGAGLLDKKGREVLAPRKGVKLISEVRKGAAIYSDGEAYGLMTVKGDVVIRPKFDGLTFASDHLLWASMKRGDDSVYMLYDLQGHKLNDEEYRSVSPFYNDDMAFVRFNAKEIGIVDDNGHDYCANVFIHNLVDYNADRLEWIEPDRLNIAQILGDVSVEEDQLGDYRIGMTSSDIVNTYCRHDSEADLPTPENYCYKTLLSYSGEHNDISYSVILEATGALADYNLYWMNWDYERSYYWTRAEIESVTLTLRGGKVSARPRKVHDALVDKLKAWGTVYKKGDHGTSIDLGSSRGYVVTFDDNSVTLKLYNNDSYRYAELDNVSASAGAAVDSVAVQ